MRETNILVALPAYGGEVKLSCADSLWKLKQHFNDRGIAHDLAAIDYGFIDVSRNILASRCFNAKKFSHLLFVDSDMSFGPRAVERLIAAEKDVVGIACARRTIDMSTVIEQSKKHDAKRAIARSVQFNIYLPGPNKRMVVKDGLCEVAGIGMGLTLIATSALEQLVATQKIRTLAKHRYASHGLDGPLLGFFDRSGDDDLTEDYSFCLRWKSLCGGSVWAIIDEEIGHVGEFVYISTFWDGYGTR